MGQPDAIVLADMFGGEDFILPNDLTNLRKYDIYTKLLIDGMPSPIFSATTFAPITSRMEVPPQQSRDVLMKVSREKYTKSRSFVENKIFDYAKKIRDDEIKFKKQQEAHKEKLKEQKAEENRKKMEERLKAKGITPYANTQNPEEKQENINNTQNSPENTNINHNAPPQNQQGNKKKFKPKKPKSA